MKPLLLFLLLSTAACKSKDTCDISRNNTGEYIALVGPRCDLAFTIDKDSNLVIHNDKQFIKWFYEEMNRINEANDKISDLESQLYRIGQWASECEYEYYLHGEKVKYLGHRHSSKCKNHKDHYDILSPARKFYDERKSRLFIGNNSGDSVIIISAKAYEILNKKK